MAEVYSFNEGSGWVWTGNSTTSALFTYVVDAAVQFTKRRNSARAPYSNQYTYVPIDNMARVTVNQMKSQITARALFLNGADGDIHVKTKSVQPGQNVSAGWLLWSGTFLSTRDNSVAGGIDTISHDAIFQTASAY